MKKIGILFGKERSFPQAFVDRINEKNVDGIAAEEVSIDKVMQNVATDYAVIIDRISQDVPFYRAFLKNAALTGTAVINNPFWWSADEKFFNNALAVKVGVPVPNTVLLPSKEHPEDTSADSFSNLSFPLDWDGIFEYVGFPAYMKPFAGGGWKHVYKINDAEDFFDKYNQTGKLVMMLQEEIKFTAYFRCYCIGRKYIKIMHYEPRNPHHLRYDAHHDVSAELMDLMEQYVLKLNAALGYDFNTVELAIRDGVPYAIDFCNPAPDAAVDSVGQENFDWVVETSANYAIERALAQIPGQENLTWGTFISEAVNGRQSSSSGPVLAAMEATEPDIVELANKKPFQPKKVKTSSGQKIIDVDFGEESKTLFGSAAERVRRDLLSLIGTAPVDQKDDLQRINGIGPKLEEMLNDMEIYTFSQISQMGKVEYDLLDSLLVAFKGRAQRDDWAGQAQAILAGITYDSLFSSEEE